MKYKTSHPFAEYFHFEKAKVDPGLLEIEKNAQHAQAKAFFDFNYAIDLKHNRDLELVDLDRPRSVILPKSVRNRSKVVYAGLDPVFAVLDQNYNLITYMVFGSVIRVEYLGKKGEEKKVKYFKCL